MGIVNDLEASVLSTTQWSDLEIQIFGLFEVHKMLVKHLHQSVTLVNGFLQGAGRRSNVVVTEVPYCKESITPDNVYVLDTGLKVWQVSPNSTWFSHY